MLHVHFPTTDGRYTEPQAEQKLLLKQLKLDLPQPPPRITAPARPLPIPTNAAE